MEITYYGHSSVGVKLEGAHLLFDPFIRPNGLAWDIDVASIRPDYIFLSHCHEDHVADLVEIQGNSGAVVIAIVETAAWAEKQGIPADKIVALNFGGTFTASFGSAKMVYALHTNSTPEGDYAGEPAGFLIKAGAKTFYFAGDTALTTEMQLLAGSAIDCAFLPIGGHYTMDVEDAVLASNLINCSEIIGIHYDTFPPIKIDQELAKRTFKDAGKSLHLLTIGEPFKVD